MDDIDWSRIDKTKFFVHGLGLFSGVTTMLFPLSVVKTRQMASNGVSGGFQGTKQTAKMVWQSEGIPGFYRGFATVVFGTIPARTIYLTSLEITKSAMQRMGKQLQLSDTTTAGVSNFAAGACASLSTQLVTVPIDVVSQRQMVHGADISSTTRAASRMGGSVSSTSTRGLEGVYSGSQSGLPSSHPGGQIGVSGAQANSPASSSNCSSSANVPGAPAHSTTSSSSTGRGAATSPTQQHAHPSSSPSTSSSNGSVVSSGGGQQGSPPSNSASNPSGGTPSNSRHFSSTAAAASNSSTSSRGCVSVPNRGGWACSSTTGGGYVFLDRGSVLGASCSKTPGSKRGGGGGDLGARIAWGSRCLSDGASSSSTSAAQGTQAVPNGFHIARRILKQEGLLGLYRGFGVSVATFVPSSAVWWSAYGVYQQVVAHAYTSAFKAAPPISSYTLPGAGAVQAPNTQAPLQQQKQQHEQQQHAGGVTGGLLSTAEIMMIQTGSSMLAGATSSLITNPLDLIKTRIQVAHRLEGQPATFRSVITEILAEDGPFGLFRGVLPRMVNAALWGTCMVTVYEFLRRASRKEPDQE